MCPSLRGAPESRAMVSVGDDGGDARQQNPGALRGAVLTANGLGGRGTWTTKQGVDYSTFRLALLESKGGRVRPSVEPAVTDTTAVSSNATSRTSSTNDLSRSTADTREPSTSGRASRCQTRRTQTQRQTGRRRKRRLRHPTSSLRLSSWTTACTTTSPMTCGRISASSSVRA